MSAQVKRAPSGAIITDDSVSDDVRAFYCSVIAPNGRDYRLVLGPFATKEEAEARVDDVRHYCSDNFRDGHWYAYGTAGIAGSEDLPNGILNHALKFEPAFCETCSRSLSNNCPQHGAGVRP